MIICFSGTGNTRMVADQLRELLSDDIVRLQPGLLQDPKRVVIEMDDDDDRLIWAMPVYCWGLPKVITDVIKYARLVSDKPVRHYLVCTCGDDVGMTDRIWRRMIGRRGWTAVSAFSVQMPNTFVFLPGFDVDTNAVARTKIQAAQQRVQTIAERIDDDSRTETDVVRGAWPLTKSYILRPLFNTFYVSSKPFHTADNCVGCGKCARACPMNLIAMDDNRPVWTNSRMCTLCSRCYHYCPRRAVRYGSFTEQKGRYMCPVAPK